MQNGFETSLSSVKTKVHCRHRHQETSSIPIFNLTMIKRQSCGLDGCSDILKKRLNSLRRRAAKLILPGTTLTTDQKLREMRIMNLHKQLDYNKGLFMYRVLSNEAQSIYLTCIHTLPYAIPTLGTITLLCLGHG